MARFTRGNFFVYSLAVALPFHPCCLQENILQSCEVGLQSLAPNRPYENLVLSEFPVALKKIADTLSVEAF